MLQQLQLRETKAHISKPPSLSKKPAASIRWSSPIRQCFRAPPAEILYRGEGKKKEGLCQRRRAAKQLLKILSAKSSANRHRFQSRTLTLNRKQLRGKVYFLKWENAARSCCTSPAEQVYEEPWDPLSRWSELFLLRAAGNGECSQIKAHITLRMGFSSVYSIYL